MAQNPDGLLLFVTRENDVRRIHVLNATTGEQRLISDLKGSAADAGWAPDGRIWAVDTMVEDQRRLRFFDLASGEENTLSESLLLDTCLPALDWSPTGDYLAYLTGTHSKPVLNLLNLEEGTSYTIPDTQVMPLWSPDGRYMAFENQILAAADGSEIISGTIPVDLSRFSPDSRLFAYWGKTVGIYDLQTGEHTALEAVGYSGNWSSNSRYLAITDYLKAELSYYDTQTGTEQRLDLGYPINFAAWTQNDTVMLLYADFEDNLGNSVSQSLISYDVASGAVQNLLETPGWVGGVRQSGDWLAINYSLSPHEQYAPTTHIQFRNGERVIEKALTINSFNPYSNAASIAWSPDGRWLSLKAEDGIYRFNSETGNLERLPINDDLAGNPFWSPDGRYLAFQTFDEARTLQQIGVWTRTNDSIEIFPQGIEMIIGWQDSRVQDSLLYCGIG
jgi:Tol biopolymer transport system component